MSEHKAQSSRRGFLWGAAAAGAAATAVVALPSVQPEPQVDAAAKQPMPERGGGYRVSEHILNYYKTTRV